MNAKSKLDHNALSELVALDDGVGAVLTDLVDLFLTSTPTQIAAMQSALKHTDAKTIAQESHKLKSSSASLGAVEFSILCCELETAAKIGQLSDVGPILNILQGEFALVSAELRKFVANLPSV